MASGIIEYLAKARGPSACIPAGRRRQAIARRAWRRRASPVPRTLFDGEHGFFPRFANSDGCDFTAMLDGRGHAMALRRHRLQAVCACGTMAHPYIDCARKLVADGVRPGDVASIECKTAEGIVHRLWEPLAAKQNPSNGYAAKFSIPYAIAVGMLRGDAGLVEYEEAGGGATHGARARGEGALRRRSDIPTRAKLRASAYHAEDGEVREASRDIFAAAREADVGCGARGKIHRQLPLRRLERGARGSASPCCARCAPAPRSILPRCAADRGAMDSVPPKTRWPSSPARGATTDAPSALAARRRRCNVALNVRA
jgi:hypothetical protein